MTTKKRAKTIGSQRDSAKAGNFPQELTRLATASFQGERLASLQIPSNFAELGIPVKGNVPCFITYDARGNSVKGTPIIVQVNGSEVANLTYNDESGSKHRVVNLGGFLRRGDNDLRCLAACFDAIFDQTKATITVLSEGSTVIDADFVTNQIGEGFDRHWTVEFTP